jgi:succinate dehydrogenase / fumarate reductase cytochrome b subunit
MPGISHYASRKLHSLLGVLPLGAFILEHLFTNAFVLGGQKAYDKQVNFLLSLPKPVLYSLEILFIALPLLFHGIVGVKIAMEGKANPRQYPFVRNWFYSFQRWSGIYLLAFIVYHVWTTRFSGHFVYPAIGEAASAAGPLGVTGAVDDPNAYLIGSRSSIYYFMLAQMSGNWALGLVYVLGVLTAAFHFSNGLWTFCITWGITVGERAQRVAKVVFNLLGVALFVLGFATVMHLVLTKNPFVA